jgi:outer membrane receptor protein involved in Fe transport
MSNRFYKYALGERTGIEQQFNYQWDKVHLLTGGISYETFYAIPRTPDLPYPYNTNLSPQQQNFSYTNTDIPIEIGEFDYHNFAMYAQLHSRWNNHWSSVLGVRYDNNSRYEKTINPRLALTYQPTQKSVFKLLYGEAFRAPSAYESWRSYGSFSGERNAAGEYVASFFAAPNPNLQPEKLRNLELSFLHQWKHTQFMASAYYTNVDDMIMSRDEVVPRQYIPGAAIQHTNIADNIGTAKHLGLDLTLDYRRDLSSDWMGEFWGTYSLLEGSVNNNISKIETDLPFIAKHKLKLGATLTYQQKYFITPKWYLIGTTQTNYFDATDKTKRLTSPGYGVVDIHFGVRKVFPGLTIKASILNLLDRHYTHAGGESASSSFLGSPQQPRTWGLGIEYQF